MMIFPHGAIEESAELHPIRQVSQLVRDAIYWRRQDEHDLAQVPTYCRGVAHTCSLSGGALAHKSSATSSRKLHGMSGARSLSSPPRIRSACGRWRRSGIAVNVRSLSEQRASEMFAGRSACSGTSPDTGRSACPQAQHSRPERGAVAANGFL